MCVATLFVLFFMFFFVFFWSWMLLGLLLLFCFWEEYGLPPLTQTHLSNTPNRAILRMGWWRIEKKWGDSRWWGVLSTHGGEIAQKCDICDQKGQILRYQGAFLFCLDLIGGILLVLSCWKWWWRDGAIFEKGKRITPLQSWQRPSVGRRTPEWIIFNWTVLERDGDHN